MPRYFFHVHDRDDVLRDEVGLDLADEQAARTEAINAARSILADEIMHMGMLDFTPFIDVTDTAGQLLFNVRFASAVEIYAG